MESSGSEKNKVAVMNDVFKDFNYNTNSSFEPAAPKIVKPAPFSQAVCNFAKKITKSVPDVKPK